MTTIGRDTVPRIVLASASTARAQVLERAGVPVAIEPAGIDEEAFLLYGLAGRGNAADTRKLAADTRDRLTEQAGIEAWLSDIAEVAGRDPAFAAEIAECARLIKGYGGTHKRGAGNYARWLHRFFRYRSYGTQLAPTSGSMGYGLPASIAAAVLKPQVPVVCLCGDGCFMMTCQELATAARYKLDIKILLMTVLTVLKREGISQEGHPTMEKFRGSQG